MTVPITALGWIAAWADGEHLNDEPFAADPALDSHADEPLDDLVFQRLQQGWAQAKPSALPLSSLLPPL